MHVASLRDDAGAELDWAAELEPLCAILRVTRTDCPGAPQMLFMTEPGVIGKVGLNSAGVGVCLNMLQCAAPVSGVHCVLRAVLESPPLLRRRRGSALRHEERCRPLS